MFSVCIITKDEAEKLRHCLSAIKERLSGYDYEVVVTDTGSSDDSVAIAKSYTENVYAFEWSGDFAAAKNYCIDRAASDNILALDTDEYIENIDIDGLLRFYETVSDHVLGLIGLKNHFFYDDEERTAKEWIPRVFNRRYFRYEGQIHEQLVPIGQTQEKGDISGVGRVRLGIEADHDGYMLTPEATEKKAKRNIELLREELDNQTSSGDTERLPYTLYQLGKAYYFAGDYAVAADYFGRALGFDLDERLEYVIDMVASYGYALINSGQEESAQDLEGVYDAFSDDADYLFVMGLIYMKNARFDEAVAMFKKAADCREARIEGVNGFLALYNIGVIYECLGDIERAAEYYGQCGGYKPAADRLEAIAAGDGGTGADDVGTAKYKVVFLPYKAAMWDSMESVYLACAGDPELETVVMPIPYFSVDEATGKAAEHIETGYPAGIRTEDYRTFDLKKYAPDVIFIHNPYDGANMVTSVHPDYYSDRLRGLARLLIYVPYYVSPNGLSQNMSVLPAYKNIDYWIVPSVRFKEEAADNPFYDKMVPLGSPKYDRVIRLSREKHEPPAEWGAIPAGKKKILLCSTIASVLAYTDAYIENYNRLFEYLKSRDDVTIIWRPHPLLGSTIRTLRAGSYDKFKELCDRFEAENIGITDRTSDISMAVACTDAEIDDGSSIMSLYMATGKPTVRYYGAELDIGSVAGFIDKVSKDETQELVSANLKYISEWAAYLDGSSGEHIREWMMSVLKRGIY